MARLGVPPTRWPRARLIATGTRGKTTIGRSPISFRSFHASSLGGHTNSATVSRGLAKSRRSAMPTVTPRWSDWLGGTHPRIEIGIEDVDGDAEEDDECGAVERDAHDR